MNGIDPEVWLTWLLDCLPDPRCIRIFKRKGVTVAKQTLIIARMEARFGRTRGAAGPPTRACRFFKSRPFQIDGLMHSGSGSHMHVNNL